MSDDQKNHFIADTSSHQVLLNGFFVLIKFAIYTGIGLFFVPYLVGKFGTTGYGLIALAGILTQYIGLISNSIASSVSRFLMVELTRENWNGANEIFNSALISYLVLFLLQIPLFALGIWKLDVLISFPDASSWSFRYLVFANAVCYGLNLFTGVFGSIFSARNRLDVTSKMETMFLLLRTIALFIVLESYPVDLKYVGHVELVIAVLRFATMYGFFKCYAGQLHISLSRFSFKWFRPVLSMSGWMLLSNFGFALFLNTDVWILNRLVSSDLAGVYAALLVWPFFIKQIANQVAAILTPVFTIDLANFKTEKVAKLCIASSSVLVLVTLAISAPILSCSKEILELWKPELAQYHILLSLMVFILAFTIPETVLEIVFQAQNKMSLKGRNDIICGFMNVTLSLAFVACGFGVYGVAIGTSVALFIRNAILTPLQVTRMLKSSFLPYWFLHGISFIGISLAFATGMIFHKYQFRGDIFETSFYGFLSILLGAIVPLILLCGWKRTLSIPRLLVQSVINRKLNTQLLELFIKTPGHHNKEIVFL